MEQVANIRTCRPVFDVNELKFLLRLCLEERRRLMAEIGEINRKLWDIETRTDVEILTGDVILETDFDALHAQEDKLTGKKIVRRQRLMVILGFIERFGRILDGTVSQHGGRLSWSSVRARELLDGIAVGTWFQRPVLPDDENGRQGEK